MCYFSGFFLFIIIVFTIMFCCTFRRIGLHSFHILRDYFDSYFIFDFGLGLALVAANREIGLEVNADKTKYLVHFPRSECRTNSQCEG